MNTNDEPVWEAGVINADVTSDVHIGCRAEVESFGDERTVLLARIRELRAEVERLHLELERHQVTGDYEMGQHHANAALQAEVERLRAALTLGQVMLDSLNDENEFNPDTVHAFAVALGELAY
jgi:predicted RNase H-like nuclease (RuvC/YqgF family)